MIFVRRSVVIFL